MRKALLVLLMTGSALAQIQQTYTGTIKDLSGAAVTSGQVNFTLAPPTGSTIPGIGSFVPTTVSCNINADGTLSGYVGGVVSGACIVTANISLSPTGTSYRICEQPQFVTPGSCFYDYALGGTKDISSVAPTLSTGPINYGAPAGPQGSPGPVGPPGGSLSYPGVTSDGAGGLSKAQTVFNVKGYGATGNGITDDSAAINTAISALDTAGGGVLYFPYSEQKGSYFSQNCNFVLASSTIVRGDGASTRDSTSISINRTGVSVPATVNTPGSTVICGSPTATLFTVTGNSGKFENISLLNTSTSTPTAGAAIFTNSSYHSQRIDYDNVWVWGFYDGIHVGVGNSWVMTNSQIYNTVRYGLWIQNTLITDAGDWTVSGTLFSSGPRTAAGSAAVYQTSSGGGKFIANKVNTVGGGFFDRGIWLNLAGSVQGQYSLNNIEATAKEPIFIENAWPWLTFTDNMLIAPAGFADIAAANGLNNAYIGGGTLNGLGAGAPYAVNLQGTLITVTVMPFAGNGWTVAPTNMVTNASPGNINNTLLNANAFNGNTFTADLGTFNSGANIGTSTAGGSVNWAGKSGGANWNCGTVSGVGLKCLSSGGAEFDLFDNSMVNSGHGPFAIGGVAGFTGTKTGAACVFTIQGGLVMNVTGC